MHRIAVSYEGESLNLEIDEDRLLASWSGPGGMPLAQVASATRTALANPIGYPPLLQTLVPGDRVAIACDPEGAGVIQALEEVIGTLKQAEVGTITVVVPITSVDLSGISVPVVQHRRDDREQLAYLATTQSGQRVYLNRELTEADSVVTICRVAPDDRGRLHGPWSLLSPAFADDDGLRSDRTAVSDASDESNEVPWLLGNPFQVALLSADRGVGNVLAGGAETVLQATEDVIEADWTLRINDSADLVVAGVGDGLTPTNWNSLAAAIFAAMKLVRRGGKIVLLSHLDAPIGPALGKLMEERERGRETLNLRGRELDFDWPIAHCLAEALRWADLFLLSRLNADLVDSLGICPLDNAAQTKRLLDEAHSVVVLSHADLTRTVVVDEDEDSAD